VLIAGARRVAGGLVRAAPGRELPRRLVAGRVLALAAVRGLAEVPFFLAPFFLAVAAFGADPDRVVPPLDLAAVVAGLAVLALAVRDLLPAILVPAILVPAILVVLALAAVVRDAGLADLADDLLAAGLAVTGLLADALRADGRVAFPALAAVDRFAAGLRAGAAEVAGLTVDIEFAAVVRALAAVVIALVAVFTDCMAVDSVRAEDVALVAAAVILVAAEVTLVAADETVRAAVAGVWPADEARLLGRVAARAGRRVPLVRAVVLRGLAERAGLAVVVRDAGLALVD
jgi:hypothetical protein